jgi:hypothetical protein
MMESLNKLSPRDFEQMIARMLASFGWEVSLTPPGRDSGVDIIGVTKDPSGLESTWAIECKYFSADHPAGVSAVRQLIGVREALGFDNALLVTSGGITDEARSLAERVHGIHLVDRELLAVWLARFDAKSIPAPTKPKPFASCFVSYSAADTEFADYLVKRLRREKVRVWYAADQMSPGQKVVDQIEAAIGTFDRLLVVLSSASITSKWVTTEVRKAFARQKEEKRQILFPVSLISFGQLKKWESIDPDTGEDLALELRSYFIPDFSEWRIPAHFDAQFARLLDGLRTS